MFIAKRFETDDFYILFDSTSFETGPLTYGNFRDYPEDVVELVETTFEKYLSLPKDDDKFVVFNVHKDEVVNVNEKLSKLVER